LAGIEIGFTAQQSRTVKEHVTEHVECSIIIAFSRRRRIPNDSVDTGRACNRRRQSLWIDRLRR